MKSVYIPALISFAVGIGLLATSASSNAELSVLEFTVLSPVVRGLGIVVLIFGAIAFLAAYGSTLPPRQQETRQPVGDRHGKSEDVGEPLHEQRDLSHQA